MIDDSVQITATSPARLRALARVRRGERASGRETIGGVVVSGRGRAPIARNRTVASRPTGKFSASQSLENSENGERISILREPVPRAGRMPLASLAGIAAREGLTAKRGRREMAPQRLEKIESAPGNGMASEASNPQHLVHGRATDPSFSRPDPAVGEGRRRRSVAIADPRRLRRRGETEREIFPLAKP